MEATVGRTLAQPHPLREKEAIESITQRISLARFASASLSLPPTLSAAAKMDDASIRMKPQPVSSTQEVLAGLVERVTFHNAENGFCVLRAKVRGHRDLVTVVGHAATIAAGEWITASGEWVNDRTHGQQFKARF